MHIDGLYYGLKLDGVTMYIVERFIYGMVYLASTVFNGITTCCVSFGITRLRCVSYGITRLRCISNGITRLICTSDEIIRLTYAFDKITKLMCVSNVITREICASYEIAKLLCKGNARGRPVKGNKDS
ncbi:mucin-19-like isoform X13 [Cucumis melo var. makuwa]|uniref:Mucin-19-like isoform X13 n=1 Tax=Cucumis melo var. makuwa TaxID=1194695 RepID=A0A5D3E4X0_CUCMM|nr:mucin-19-like isoform X13 [Cucumis melo var. makuwa]